MPDVEVRVREAGLQPVGSVESAVAVYASRSKAAGGFAGWCWLRFLLIAGIYVGFHIGRGWVPADDGTLSQSALRVLQGQLPHRDFAEIYTGGLSFIHALAFRVFGVNLMSLRICVFLFFLAWLPAVYYIALRFTSAIAAGLITLLAVVVELSELSGGDAVLVQPVLRDVWSGGAAALPRSADAAMAVCGGSMRRSVDPDQGDRGLLHCRECCCS